MILDSFIVFQLMYYSLCDLNEEKPKRSIDDFLSDANPFFCEGETSADPAVYDEFKTKFNSFSNHDEYSYEFICYYLKTLDYYKGVYKLFKSVKKEEYLQYAKNLTEKESNIFKK